MADPEFLQVSRHVIGPVRDGLSPEHVVPAHAWQAARSTGAFTLVGCTVGPGFDFDDFQMLKDLPTESEVAARQPDAAPFV